MRLKMGRMSGLLREPGRRTGKLFLLPPFLGLGDGVFATGGWSVVFSSGKASVTPFVGSVSVVRSCIDESSVGVGERNGGELGVVSSASSFAGNIGSAVAGKISSVVVGRKKKGKVDVEVLVGVKKNSGPSDVVVVASLVGVKKNSGLSDATSVVSLAGVMKAIGGASDVGGITMLVVD